MQGETPDYNKRLGYGTDQGRWLKQQLASSGAGHNPYSAHAARKQPPAAGLASPPPSAQPAYDYAYDHAAYDHAAYDHAAYDHTAYDHAAYDHAAAPPPQPYAAAVPAPEWQPSPAAWPANGHAAAQGTTSSYATPAIASPQPVAAAPLLPPESTASAAAAPPRSSGFNPGLLGSRMSKPSPAPPTSLSGAATPTPVPMAVTPSCQSSNPVATAALNATGSVPSSHTHPAAASGGAVYANGGAAYANGGAAYANGGTASAPTPTYTPPPPALNVQPPAPVPAAAPPMPVAPAAQPASLASHAPYHHQPPTAVPAQPAAAYGAYAGHAGYAQPAPQAPYHHHPAAATPAQPAVAYGGYPGHASYAQPAATESIPPPSQPSAVPDYNQRLGFGTDQCAYPRLAALAPRSRPARAPLALGAAASVLYHESLHAGQPCSGVPMRAPTPASKLSTGADG